MLRRVSLNFILISMLVDAAQAALALKLATELRPDLHWLPLSRPIDANGLLPDSFYLAAPLLWLIVFHAFALYDPQRVYRFSEEARRAVVAGVVASLATAGLLYLSYRGTSRWLFLLFALLATAFPILWRGAVHLAIRLAHREVPLEQRVAIVGTGALAREAAEAIEAHRWAGLSLVGFVDDALAASAPRNGGSHRNGGSAPIDAPAEPPFSRARQTALATALALERATGVKTMPLPAPVLGTLEDVREVVSRYQVDAVVIAVPGTAYDHVQQLVDTLHDLPVRVLLVPDYLALVLHRARAEDFAGVPVVDLRAPALSDYQRMAKRAFDLVIGSICLLAALPVMAVIALAVKLDSKGPIIFRQVRVGENGRHFTMHKFRTMIADAERHASEVLTADHDGHLIHKRRDDPRVTRVGRWLRRTSLDELPQLFDVLKGDMSLVGPRPEMPWLVERYEGWQRRRFAVPQGMTGWWQVNGRSDRPMHLHTEDDLYYIQNYSFWLDLRILWRTLWIVLLGKGAY